MELSRQTAQSSANYILSIGGCSAVWVVQHCPRIITGTVAAWSCATSMQSCFALSSVGSMSTRTFSLFFWAVVTSDKCFSTFAMLPESSFIFGVEASALFAFCLFPLQVLLCYIDLSWSRSLGVQLSLYTRHRILGRFFYLLHPPSWFWQQGARYCVPWLGAEGEGFINFKCAHGTSHSVGEAFIAHCWAIFPTSLNSYLWSVLEQLSRSLVTGESSRSCHHLQWSISMVYWRVYWMVY